MHSNFNESKADNNFKSWLKEHKCSDKIISDILEENSSWYFSKLEKHITNYPKLFTILLQKGYSGRAIADVFCSDCYENYLDDRESIAIELVEEVYHFNKILTITNDCKKLINHKDYYVMLYKKKLSNDKYKSIFSFFVQSCSEDQIYRCKNNEKLLDLLVANDVTDQIIYTILHNDKAASVTDDTGLLYFLFESGGIIFNEFSSGGQRQKNFIIKNHIVYSLLKTGNLKISDLLYTGRNGYKFIRSDAEENIKRLVEEKIKKAIAQSNLQDDHNARGVGVVEQIIGQLNNQSAVPDTHYLNNQNKVPSLLALSIGAILNISQTNALA